MGYDHAHLAWTVVQQALILVGAASLAGLLLALVTYAALVDATNLPIRMTAARVGGVFALTVALSVAASLFALRRLRAADPADLF